MGYQSYSEGRAFLKIVFTTFFIIALMTGLNFLLIFNSMGSNPLLPIHRSIASIPEPLIEEKKHPETPVLEINCAQEPKKIELNTKALNVRFIFSNCKKVSELKNESNNNQGELFAMNGDKWTSDFIFLKTGLNKIKARWGENNQVIEITRENVNHNPPPKAL